MRENSALEEQALGYPGGCDVCRGVGFVLDEAAWERQGFRGGLVPCPRCGASVAQKRLERLSGLSEEMHGWSLDEYGTSFGRAEALAAARAAVENPRGFITFWGNWGTGKTYLLAAIVNECRKRGRTAVYTTAAELLDRLRQTLDEEADESYYPFWERMLTVQVLALDEVEKFRASPWAEERFFTLVDSRYRKAGECLTLFATNVEVKHGCRIITHTSWPGYLESRLLDGRFQVVKVGNGDLRPWVRWQAG